MIVFTVVLYFSTKLVSACQCNALGSLNNECDSYSGQCKCRPYFTGKFCEQCTSSNLIFPHCVGDAKCECNKMGTWFDADKKGPCIEGVRIFLLIIFSFFYFSISSQCPLSICPANIRKPKNETCVFSKGYRKGSSA